ncbi:hypothetical protein [Agarilytica rhodophyticola]|uniref:hypothetical protein n=1 Tax=Agarilytica rhodophyticola TaxID=1737490 RepID=UPI000B345214|nr:hypothetical protein [Agarilytica rhodophyticola]
MAAANVATGRAAGAVMAGKSLAMQTAIGAGTGGLIGAGNDAAMQASRIDAGQQQSYDLGQTAVATTGGALLGGAVPAAGQFAQQVASSLSKSKIGNFFTRESKGGPSASNGANQGALKGKSESATRKSDVTEIEVQQASFKKSPGNPDDPDFVGPLFHYGPFYRRGDSIENVVSIMKSGEYRGNPPGNYIQNDIAKVQAWYGKEHAPPGAGFEFYTTVKPRSGTKKHFPEWSYDSYLPHNTTPGVKTNSKEQAVIPCVVTAVFCGGVRNPPPKLDGNGNLIE